MPGDFIIIIKLMREKIWSLSSSNIIIISITVITIRCIRPCHQAPQEWQSSPTSKPRVPRAMTWTLRVALLCDNDWCIDLPPQPTTTKVHKVSGVSLMRYNEQEQHSLVYILQDPMHFFHMWDFSPQENYYVSLCGALPFIKNKIKLFGSLLW